MQVCRAARGSTPALRSRATENGKKEIIRALGNSDFAFAPRNLYVQFYFFHVIIVHNGWSIVVKVYYISTM
jgi:hypothetical protein